MTNGREVGKDEIPVTLNGVPTAIRVGTTVGEVLRLLTDSTTGCAVARNGDVVPRSAWSTEVLRAEDRIEVLTAVQGG